MGSADSDRAARYALRRPADELVGGAQAEVRLQAGVSHLAIADGRAAGVVLRSGETIPADHVIVAVPHWLVLDLLPAECAAHPDTHPSAATGNGADFERPPLVRPADPVSPRAPTGNAAHSPSPAELPHAVLIDRLSQWIFNRDVLHAGPAATVQLPAGATHRHTAQATTTR